MPVLAEGKIEYTFSDHWNVTLYDDWAFYKNRFVNSCCGNKAVDFLAYNPNDRTLWLIELKDYREYRRAKDETLTLWDETALKVRDTLAGIFAARIDTTHPEHSYAASALGARKFRVVLHLEQPNTHSKLFPRKYDPSKLQLKLKQLLRPIDAHPQVVELHDMISVPWEARSLPRL